VTDHQTTRPKAVAQKQEPFLIVGVIRIVDQAGAFVQENRLSFLERHAMFN
jgi:hypothetical protein